MTANKRDIDPNDDAALDDVAEDIADAIDAPTVDTPTIIKANEKNMYRLLSAYYWSSKSGGADGKDNIHVQFDSITIGDVESLARQEVQRKIQSACRSSAGMVERIKMSTREKPYVFKVSELLKGMKREDMAAVVADMKARGLSNDEIVATLLKS